MKLIYLESAWKFDSFDVSFSIKIPFFRVSFTIKPGRSLLQFVTTNCLIVGFIHDSARYCYDKLKTYYYFSSYFQHGVIVDKTMWWCFVNYFYNAQNRLMGCGIIWFMFCKCDIAQNWTWKLQNLNSYNSSDFRISIDSIFWLNKKKSFF